jgi:hypothetical protein
LELGDIAAMMLTADLQVRIISPAKPTKAKDVSLA